MFTILPALILIFNNAIAKTEKRILKIPTGALAKFSIKARVPLTIIFVGLFVAAYFFQTKTDISFSMNTTNGIKDYFTADNTTVVLFANEDSGNIGKIADEISKDENVRSVISYPTLIGKESTAEELTEDISALTDDFKIETRMLKFIYYKYHNEDNLPSVRAADLINFISEDIAEDEMFSQYIDDSLKDNVSMLGKFSDKNTLTREMTAEELGEFFGMDGEEKKQQISGMGDMLETAVNSLKRENHSLLQITSKYPDESDETMSFMAQLNRLCDENLTEDHYIIGSSEMYYEMSQTFRREMLIMTLLTAISIFIIVLLSFRNGLIPLILVLIVQCGVFITAAVSYLRGYSVNYLAYLIVQCILMGATIDYGILFTNYYREYRKAESRDEALKSAYAGSVHTILTSGLIMIGVTGVIGFTSPDPTIGPICQTISVGCLSAVLLILFVLPGMLAASDRLIVKRKKPAEEDKKES